MPSINPEKCYKSLPVEPSVAPTSPLTIDEAATLLASLSTHTKDYIATELTRIMGPVSTFTNKEDLIKAFQAVMAHLRKTGVSDTEKRTIADKLLEGIDMCASGYHDRVKYILLGLSRPNTIDELLERIRFSIVDHAASAATNEVHKHNSFFQAAVLNYGIRPLNSSDVYSNPLRPNEALALDQAFAQKYHPIAILAELQAFLESELRGYHLYAGKKLLEEPYQLGPINKIVDFLNRILNTSFKEEDIFIQEWNETAYCNVSTDINWAFIQDCLWKKLRDERYIDFSVEEKTLLSALYAHKMPTPPEDAGASASASAGAGAGAGASVGASAGASVGASAGAGVHTSTVEAALELPALLGNKTYQSLFYSLGITQYPSIIRFQNQRVAIAEILATPASEGDIQDALAYLKLIHAFFSEDKDPYTNYINKFLTPWLTKPDHIAAIFTMKLDDLSSIELFLLACERLPQETIRLHFQSHLQDIQKAFWLTLKKDHQLANNFINLIKNIAPSLEQPLFTAQDAEGNNALMLAAAHQPKTLPLLLERLVTFPLKMRENLFQTKCRVGYNTLMLAILHQQPTALPILFEHIKKLEFKIQKELLTVTVDNRNILMLATSTTIPPSLLTQIISVFSEPNVGKEVLKQLLKAKNSSGYNALMLAAAIKEPASFTSLLDQITTVFDEPAEQKALLKELLTAKNNTDFNILMLAAINPDSLSSLLAKIRIVFTDKPGQQQELLEELLTARDRYGYNVLMLSYFQPRAIASLLEEITTVFADKPAVQQGLLRKLLTAKSNLDDVTILMQAVVAPEVFSLLLRQMATAFAHNPDAQKDLLRELLTAQDSDGNSVLMKAIAAEEPTALSSLLEHITSVFGDSLERKELLKTLLTTKNKKDVTPLILAAYKPAALPSILAEITTVFGDTQSLKELLTAKDANGDHALTLAALDSTALAPLLEYITTTFDDPTKQKKLLMKLLPATNNYGDNTLMMAAQNPDALALLLEHITTVFGDTPKPKRKKLLEKLLTATNVDGENALKMAAQNPAALSLLLEHITTVFSDTTKRKKLLKDLLTTTNIWGENILSRLAYKSSDTLPILLGHIRNVFGDTPEEKTLLRDLLTATNTNNDNALLFAAYNTTKFSSFLGHIAAIFVDISERKKLLEELLTTNTHRQNALLIVVWSPIALSSLLELITTTFVDIQERKKLLEHLLTAKDPSGNNALKLAAQNPDTFSSLLRFITTTFCDITERKKLLEKLLTETNQQGVNTLISATYKPDAFASFLTQIKTTFDNISERQDLLKKLLTAKDRDGYNALILLAKYQSENLPLLLEEITAAFGDTTERKTLLRELLLPVFNLRVHYPSPIGLDSDIPLILGRIITAFVNLAGGKKLLEELLTAKDTNGNNALMIALKNADTLSLLLENITTTFGDITERKELLRELLTAKDKNGNNALMIASQNPAMLSPLLEHITTTFGDITERKELLRELLTVRNTNDNNALKLAVQNPDTFSSLLRFITTTFGDITERNSLLAGLLLTAKNKQGANALMLAAQYQPVTLPLFSEVIKSFGHLQQENLLLPLLPHINTSAFSETHFSAVLDFIKTLDPRVEAMVLKHLLTTNLKTAPWHGVLLPLATQKRYLPVILARIKSFEPQLQQEVLRATNPRGNPLLKRIMMHTDDDPTALPNFLNLVKTLALPLQKEILMPEGEANAFLEVRDTNIMNKFLDIDLGIQLDMLRAPDTNSTLKAYKEKLIPYKLQQLDKGTTIEKKIHAQLNHMKFNANHKREAILIALDHLRNTQSPDGNIDTSIKEALRNPKSELYKAFNKRRYTFFIPLTEKTQSLREMLKTIDNPSTPRGNTRT